MNPEFNRRDFLRFAGGGALGAAASGVTLKGISTFNAALAAEEVNVPRGAETWSLSICSLCPAGCGLRVRKIDKRAVKIQGNPIHPVNRGGLCPRGLAGLQVLYHPDRLQGPMKNTGSRENPRWESISWDEATGALAQMLQELKDRKQAHTLVFVDGQSGHLRPRLFRKFLRAYGSPNYLRTPAALDTLQAAAYLQQGVDRGIAYDLESARYVLSFGAGLLEGWGSPVGSMRAFGIWRDPAAGRRTKFVQIEPRLSITAARADEWVALRPGTEAALALGIAYVLLTEGLYDSRFVEEHTFGFEDWKDAKGRSHMGFRSLVLGEYRLNDVAAITQVPVETILRLSRELGRNRPALAIAGQPGSALGGDIYASMAVHSLNALVGSLEVAGGALVSPGLPGDEQTDLHAPGSHAASILSREDSLLPWHDLSRLPESILSEKPYPVRALFLHGANPVFSMPNGGDFARALQRVPFVVSFASFVDETSFRANLILPDHTDLEKWQEAATPPAFPFPLQSLTAPVVEPVYQTSDTGDVMLQVAHRMRGDLAAALPERTMEDFLRREVQELFQAQTGYTFTNSLEETWDRMSERSGWWAPSYNSADGLWDQMKQRGGWWEPNYYFAEWTRVLRTPSGKFEFYSQRLADWLQKNSAHGKEGGLAPGSDRTCLPHQQQLPEGSKEFPLLLMPVEVLPFLTGSGAELPYLQQIAGQHLFAHWESWLEINPETAASLGLEDGEQVWVESERKRARVRLRVYPGVRPGVVHLPLGYGRTQGSSWACRGVNPMDLLVSAHDPNSLLQDAKTFVRVYRT